MDFFEVNYNARELKQQMERIASFSVDHDLIEKGMYISRIDGDVVTYDIRMKKPNGGDYLGTGEMHTIEHLFATYARNSRWSEAVLYIGPMGCRTGFYMLLRNSVSKEDALALVLEAMDFIAGFEGSIPGSTRKECGNYLEHDLPAARKSAKEMADVLHGWSAEKMAYAERHVPQEGR